MKKNAKTLKHDNNKKITFLLQDEVDNYNIDDNHINDYEVDNKRNNMTNKVGNDGTDIKEEADDSDSDINDEDEIPDINDPQRSKLHIKNLNSNSKTEKLEHNTLQYLQSNKEINSNKRLLKRTIKKLEEKLNNYKDLGKTEPLKILLRRSNLKEAKKLSVSIDTKNIRRGALIQKLETMKKDESEDSIFNNFIEILQTTKKDMFDCIMISNFLNTIDDLINVLEIDTSYSKYLSQIAVGLKYRFYLNNTIICREGI